jgi:hypothetical protein
MQPDDEIGPASAQEGEEHPATIGAVTDENIVGPQPTEEAAGQLQIVALARVVNEGE